MAKQFNSIIGYSVGNPTEVIVIDANANVSANTLSVTANAGITGNITTGNANLGNLVTANFFQGDGGLLTNIAVSAGTSIVNGTSNVAVGLNGNVTLGIGGTANVLVVTPTGANITGTANVTGNANVGNLGASGSLVSVGKITAGAVLYANTDGTGGQVLTTYGNGVTYWSTVSGGGSTSSISNGTSNVNIATSGGNVTTSVAGTSNVFTVTSTGVNVAGTLNATGNLVATNLIGPLANGNSNVNIPSANGNINLTSVGNVTLIVTGTGANITGTLNTSGNANVNNLGAAQVLASANVTAPQLISNIAIGTAPFVVTSTTQVANLSVATAGLATFATTANAVAGANVSGQVANALISGTVYTNAQSNITSVGTLTGLIVGNITANSTFGNGTITATGNVIVGNLIGPLANGNSNVNIPAANGNINLTAVGNVTMIVTGTGANITGMLNVSSSANVTGVFYSAGGVLQRAVTIADGTSITVNADTTDLATQLNTQIAGTLTINAPTGTLTHGQKIMINIQSANVQTFAWNGIFTGSTDLALPTATTGSNKYDYMGFIYNSFAIKWQMLAKNFGF